MTETQQPWIWEQLLNTARVVSQRDLADKAGVSPGTVNRMIRGIGRPDSESVRKVAAVLCDGDTNLIWAAIGTGHQDYGDFEISEIEDELRLLTPSQRKAVVGLVRSMADPLGKRGRLEVEVAGELSSVPDLMFPSEAASGPDPDWEQVAADATPGEPSEYEKRVADQNRAGQGDEEGPT